MLKKITIILMLVIAVPTMLSAQKVKLEGVAKAWLRSSGPIIQDNDVNGYFFFYRIDEKSKKSRVYLLDIFDQNLNKVASKKITGSKTLMLQESAFNGDKIMFKFYDYKEKEISYRIYDKSAEFVTKKTREVTKLMASYANAAAGSDEGGQTNKTLFAIENEGFISYSAKKDKKLGYTIEHFKGEVGKKGWKYSSSSTSKENQGANLLALNNEIILNIVAKSPGAFSRKVNYSLVGIDAKTGKKKFDTNLTGKKYQTVLMNGNINSEKGEILLFGEYYPLDSKPMKDPSLGLFAYTMDMEGTITNRNYISWTKDVSKFIPVNEKGKEKGKGFTYFHKIHQTKDGRIFAIGEQFKKTVDGAGIALGMAAAALGGTSDAALMKMVVGDMIVYEFSPEFELLNVKVVEKSPTNVSLEQGMGLVNSQILAKLIDAYGAFDYSFTQVRDDGDNFTIGYVDYKKLKGEKNKFVFEALSYENGEFVEDEIDLTSEKNSSVRRVYPAKPGYILVTEYFRKEKTIESRLEKINF